jgi:hypothetical protein
MASTQHNKNSSPLAVRKQRFQRIGLNARMKNIYGRGKPKGKGSVTSTFAMPTVASAIRAGLDAKMMEGMRRFE